MSEWNGTTRVQLKGKYYWGSAPVAYYTTAASGSAGVHFEHQDWMGTERMRTLYNSENNPTYANDGTFTSLPWGDAQTVASGTDSDAYHYAMLDYDAQTANDHAEFRQYGDTPGNWMSPDPYSGSYDFSNPQSLNRYAYTMNSPLSAVDPLGLAIGQPCSDTSIGCPPSTPPDPADLCSQYPNYPGCVDLCDDGDFAPCEPLAPGPTCDIFVGCFAPNNAAPNNGPAKPPLTPQQQKTCHDLNVYSKQLVLTGGATATVGGLMTLGTVTAPAGVIVAAAGGVVALAGGIVDLWAYEVCN